MLNIFELVILLSGIYFKEKNNQIYAEIYVK